MRLHNQITPGRHLFPFSLLLMLLPLASQAYDPGYGPHPILTVPGDSQGDFAQVEGWPEGKTPIAAQGFAVSAYATGLRHPRWLYVLPNGDVLVAETDAPANKGAANRITLLRGIDKNGQAKIRTVFLSGLHSPFGMTLIGHDFYVADTDALLRFPYHEGDTNISAEGVKLIDLPAGTIDHHWTKNVIASPDGTKLYVTAGSNSNIAENGMEEEQGRAAIWEVDVKTGKTRIFASGLRNPNGLGWQPESGKLWAVVNERDELGNNLPPDYLTQVKENGFYGWPYSYWGQHVDTRVQPQKLDQVAQAQTPDYGLGAHTAALGLAFYQAHLLPAHYKNGAFIGLHGSWNRKPKSGYKVIFVPFSQGTPSGMPEDILTGFLDANGNAFGRPVGVAVDGQGALLVADDAGNTVWRVTPEQENP